MSDTMRANAALDAVATTPVQLSTQERLMVAAALDLSAEIQIGLGIDPRDTLLERLLAYRLRFGPFSDVAVPTHVADGPDTHAVVARVTGIERDGRERWRS